MSLLDELESYSSFTHSPGLGYICPYCGKACKRVKNAIVLCSCEKSHQAEQEQRELERQFRENQKKDWRTIREERKIRRRK